VTPRRHFLSWNRPLLPQAAAFLAGNWAGTGPLDLSRTLVVVPTRQAGRRLRAALAELAQGQRQAVFPPQVDTPDKLLLSGSGDPTASAVEVLLAWSEVFRELDLAAFREVFPLDPPLRDFAWSLRLADQFTALQSELAEGGLRLGQVVAQTGGDFPEVARWQQLAALETRFDQKLASRSRRDPQAAKIAGAAAPPPLPEYDRLVFLAVPDPLALAVAVAAARGGDLSVEVVVWAPESEGDAFDAWGRPLEAVWLERRLELADFERRVRLSADPSAQADRIAGLARGYGQPDGLLAVGVADSEVGPPLESALARAGLASFDPEGRPRRRDELFPLLSALAALAREPSFDALATLARCPDFLRYLGAKLGPSFSPAQWLQGLDELRRRHLPVDLAAAQAHAGELEKYPALGPALAAIQDLRLHLGVRPFAEGAAACLAAIFGGRRFNLERPEDVQRVQSAEAWSDLLRACAEAGAALEPADGWDLALKLFGEAHRTEDKPAEALELQGWLELPWEDAPHLVVAGCNDGKVPTAIVGDPFLPEALREKLGLRTNAARFARDNYLLAALAASRATSGRLDLLVGRASAAGEPLRPSRLLLACSDADLPGRVKFLFRPTPAARPTPPWHRAWRLDPPIQAPLRRLSVTAFRDYLQCPFRFYLKHVLRWSTFDPQKSELDASDFGNLCHAALEKMGGDPLYRDSIDERALREFLLHSLDEVVRARYGRELTLPLVIQVESARQRLGRAAAVQARQRQEGWRIDRTEQAFDLEIHGLRVTGKIDRIDQSVEGGHWRLLDYKTSDRAVPPGPAHFRKARGSREDAPEFARFRIAGEERVWTDLQLPLYLDALSRSLSAPPIAGYFNLPKAVAETSVLTWDDYDDETRVAARRCAEGVVDSVQAGRFWPPAELDERRDESFAELFHQGTAASVNPDFAAQVRTR